MIGSLLLLIIIGVAYLDKLTGSMGWTIALFGFIFGLAIVIGFITSIVLFFVSLSRKEPINIIKNKFLYWSILVFVIIFGIFVKVMQITGNG
jgi:hypothetical protein